MKIRVVELFAGVGGFRVGLERASQEYEFVWCNQWEPGKKNQYAFDCYQRHYGNSEHHVNDDIALVKDGIGDHDLLVGGFPCQDYSVAHTKAKGIEGKKGVLWWHINDIIENKTPKYVLLENVDRLIKSPASQRGRDFGIMLRCFADNGYAVEWRVINAADYECPQRRRRIFIFAYKNDTEFYNKCSQIDPETILMRDGFFSKEFKIKALTIERNSSFDIGKENFGNLVDLSDSFSERFYAGGVMIDYKVYTRECVPVECENPKSLEDVIEKKVEERFYVTNQEDIDKWIYLKGAKREPRINKTNGATYVYTEGAVPFPDPMDRPGRTMLTTEGRKNRCSHMIKDKTGRYRILTPIECERLNGFDDDWTKGMPESARYFTMGNALVVPLVEKMGRALIEIYGSDNSKLKMGELAKPERAEVI